jgi:hypothetical protein
MAQMSMTQDVYFRLAAAFNILELANEAPTPNDLIQERMAAYIKGPNGVDITQLAKKLKLLPYSFGKYVNQPAKLSVTPNGKRKATDVLDDSDFLVFGVAPVHAYFSHFYPVIRFVLAAVPRSTPSLSAMTSVRSRLAIVYAAPFTCPHYIAHTETHTHTVYTLVTGTHTFAHADYSAHLRTNTHTRTHLRFHTHVLARTPHAPAHTHTHPAATYTHTNVPPLAAAKLNKR